MQALPRLRKRDADTTSYVADYRTRSVRRASGFVLVGKPETEWKETSFGPVEATPAKMSAV